jgi:putative aminopeptidase FrvX
MELMLIPSLSGHEGRVRRRLAAEVAGLGLAATNDRLGNLIATASKATSSPQQPAKPIHAPRQRTAANSELPNP